jgi:signal transduction histidine kinase
MRRVPDWITTIFLGGAFVLGAIGVLSIFQVIRLNAAWFLLPSAAGLIFGSLKASELIRQTSDLAAARQAQTDMLQNQLELQQRSVDALADGLNIAIFICDSRAHVLYANLTARDMFGFEEPIGRSVLAVTLSYELEQIVLNSVGEQKSKRTEIVFTNPDERMGIADAWPHYGVSGRVFLSVYEVTDLRRLERIRQDFVANVSHELRTPMTLIRAMAETLLDETDGKTELSERYLGKIVNEIDRLSSLTQDLLTLSAAESSAVRKQPCDLAEIVREIVGRLAPRAGDKGLTLTYAGPETVSVQANPTQMTQVSLNLIENAINYTTQGSVGVSLDCSGGMAILSVCDTGIGIASEHQRRVFERFYRVDKGRSRLSGGTGLGLSIVRHIVEAHGGTVAVDSALNHGSTFTASIPIDG